jgi:putative phosphoesterase
LVSDYRTATILSDIHGIALALEAVLAVEARDPSDVLIVAGDTAAGPQPNQVIEILRQHEDRLIAISGNGDRELIEAHDGTFEGEVPRLTAWEAGAITPGNLGWLRALPGTIEFDMASLGRVHLCHATPQNDMDILLVDTRIERWQQCFADLAEDVKTVILGHTHMPFQRLVAGRRVINPGSVGMPFGQAGANWSRIRADGTIETRVTYFDINAALSDLEATGCYENAREWAFPYLTGQFTDVQAIETFGPRDGRG